MMSKPMRWNTFLCSAASVFFRLPAFQVAGLRNCREIENSRQGSLFTFGTFLRSFKMLWTILLVILILMVLGALPTWNHSRSWGYFPSGGLGLVVLVLVVLLLAGRI